ncbi:MAG: hypothetical protein KGM17_03725 [Sphingomonadales bacterium]|nr:hypothetical protein [Sphingomonadales bacterium]
MLKRRWGAAVAVVLAGAGGVAWACADPGCSPAWSVLVPDYQCAGNIALSPGNDSRINLLLLIRSLRPVAETGAAYPKRDWDNREFGRTFLTWAGLRQSYWPRAEDQRGRDAAPDSACTVAAGTVARADPPTPEVVAAFGAALAAEPKLAAADRAVLERLRAAVGCGAVDWTALPASGVARDYGAYLKATDAFYAGDWAAAKAGYAALATAGSAWVRETAAYMPIRVGLRAAVATATDQYGDFSAGKVDKAALAGAQAAIGAYLKAWPQGRYAGSARGLMRRVRWLGGDRAGLARDYEALALATPGDSEAAADLVEEIDVRLLGSDGDVAEVVKGQEAPLMLAAADLRRMRPADGKPGLTAADLAAQQPAFAGRDALYGFLGAARTIHAGEDPRPVLAAIPDDARQAGYTPLAFSRQVLRGVALGRAGDRNAAGFWRELMGGATGLYQRPLVELGLAQAWTNGGRMAAVFAPGSPVTDSATREVLLRSVAPPAILRATARDAARPAHERDLARFTLLAKGLTRGFYGDFGGDLALLQPNPPREGTIGWMAGSDPVPVGVFAKGKWSDGFACPAIAQTAATLARNPGDARAKLCLGDFLRLNGFDAFGVGYERPPVDALGGGSDQFPGQPRGRDAIYQAVIADRTAAADLRAYALYRAVMCYAPSGYNSCSGPPVGNERAEVPKATRKAWFDELKRAYPQSRWAQALRFWW